MSTSCRSGFKLLSSCCHPCVRPFSTNIALDLDPARTGGLHTFCLHTRHTAQPSSIHTLPGHLTASAVCRMRHERLRREPGSVTM